MIDHRGEVAAFLAAATLEPADIDRFLDPARAQLGPIRLRSGLCP